MVEQILQNVGPCWEFLGPEGNPGNMEKDIKTCPDSKDARTICFPSWTSSYSRCPGLAQFQIQKAHPLGNWIPISPCLGLSVVVPMASLGGVHFPPSSTGHQPSGRFPIRLWLCLPWAQFGGDTGSTLPISVSKGFSGHHSWSLSFRPRNEASTYSVSDFWGRKWT